jgi:hypothetical protein
MSRKVIERSDGINLQDLKPGEYCIHGILRDKDGNIKKEMKVTNQVQTAMKTHVADALSDQGETAMGWMAIGTGTGQAVGDNTLATENDRRALDNSTPSHSGAVVTYHRTFAAGEGTGTMTEAGVFNDASAGTMGLYDDSISFAKGASDSLELTWTLTIS